jgi:AcrR family transcriptional regulator
MGVAAKKKRTDRESRRNEIRRSLLDAIETLTAQGESYSTITLERLSTAAGISRATFYVYFQSKGDLLRAWFSATVAELSEACAAWNELGAQSSAQDLRAALRRIIAVYHRHATLIAAVADEATQDSTLRDELNAVIDLAIDSLRRQIERGQDEGWIQADLLPDETARWSMWVFERGLTQIVPTLSEAELDASTAALADMAWHLLRDEPGLLERSGAA